MHVLPWNQTVFALNYRVILFSLPFSAIFIQKREQPTRNKTEGHDLEFEPRFRFGDWQHPSWTNKILHWISRPYFLFTPGRKEESGQSSMCITFCNFNQIFWINSRMRWIYVKIPFSKENRQLCLIFKDGWRRYILNSNSFQRKREIVTPKKNWYFHARRSDHLKILYPLLERQKWAGNRKTRVSRMNFNKVTAHSDNWLSQGTSTTKISSTLDWWGFPHAANQFAFSIPTL